MTKAFLLSLTAAAVALGLMGQGAEAGPRHAAWDRIEDRIDRRESRLDRRVNLGPRDRFEDRVDRWEDRRDRQGKPVPRVVKRWERQSWKRRWGG